MTLLVVGAGSIGRRHIRNLIALGIPALNISVFDIASHVEDHVCQEFGVKRWLECMRSVDGILICSPAEKHFRLMDICNDTKTPFFVEKPATTGLAELRDDVWETQVPHLVGCNMLFRSDVSTFIQSTTAQADTGGRVNVWCHSDMLTWPGHYTAHPVFEFCHEIDIANRIDGGLDLQSLRLESIDDGDGIAIQTTTRDHHMAMSIVLRWRRTTYSRGAVCTLRRQSEVCSFSYAWGSVPDDSNYMYVAEMRHFLQVARGEATSLNTLRHAKPVIDVCERGATVVLS